MTSFEERVSRLEGITEQISERLGHIERSVDQGQESLRAEMRSGQESLRAEIRSNFHWTMGAIFTTWITLIGTVLGVLLTR